MFEEAVREMLKSKVRNAPAMDEPPAPVLRRARGRRVLNSVGLAAGLAVIAVGSLIGVKSLGTTPVHQITKLPVPWKAIPPYPSKADPGIEPCRASDVRFSVVAVPQALGFTARDDLTRCGIEKPFKVELFDAAGKRLDVPVRFAKTFSGLIVYKSEVTHGALFEWANGCGPTPSPIRYVVRLPHNGGKLQATSTNGGQLGCTGSRRNTSMTFNAGGSSPSGYVRKDPLDTLTVTLSQVPRTVQIGHELRYLVVLSNLTNTAVPLDPCPNFSQEIDVSDNSLSAAVDNKMNCAEAPRAIPAHSRLTLEMRFTIPTNAGAAPATLSWAFSRGDFGRVDNVTTRILITRA